MGLDVVELSEARDALERGGSFLAARPIEHNLLLTILHRSIEQSDAGAYWLVVDGPDVVGFASETPPGRGWVLSAMPPAAARVLAERITQPVAGVVGEASIAATFVGRWTECHDAAAPGIDPQRLYELRSLQSVATAPGALRLANDTDRGQLIEWTRAFVTELDLHPENAEETVYARIASEQFWCWDDDGPVAMASASEPVCGIARVQYVYTPAAQRGNGYATACVEHLSRALVARDLRCVLYTDLGNATSNAIYRRIGYEAVHEVLGYDLA